MFTKVVLRSFQKHRKLEIDLDRITTIVGASDKGKSSILRALRFLSRNLPSGISFVTHGKGKTRVTLEVDGDVVSRVKGPEDNSYSFNGEVYKALGQGSGGIPAKVVQTLRTSDINFQLQHDPPFWFTDTPGQISKNLNRIINLDVIDTVLSRAKAKARTNQTIVEVTEARVKEAEESVKKLRWVKKFSAGLAGIEALAKDLAETEAKEARLTSLLAQYDEAVRDRKRLRKVANAGLEVVALGGELIDLKVKHDRLIGLLTARDKELETTKAAIGDFGPVEELRGEADALAEKYRRLDFLVTQLTTAEEQVCDLQEQSRQLEKKLGGKCPYCGAILESLASSRRTCTYRKRPH